MTTPPPPAASSFPAGLAPNGGTASWDGVNTLTVSIGGKLVASHAGQALSSATTTLSSWTFGIPS